MVFAEYARVIKRHFKHKISDADLCEVLFDAVIEPLDLRNRNGEIWTVDKAEVSRIMNRKKNIPKALRNHIHDKKVQDGIENYFRTRILPRLVDDTADLIWQMMRLIDGDKNISPSHKENFRDMASPQSASLFLSEVFIHVLRQKNKSTQPARRQEYTFAEHRAIVAKVAENYGAALSYAAALNKIFYSPAYQSVCRAMQAINFNRR